MFSPHQNVSHTKEQILIRKDILSVASFDLECEELAGNSAPELCESLQLEDTVLLKSDQNIPNITMTSLRLGTFRNETFLNNANNVSPCEVGFLLNHFFLQNMKDF